MKVKKYCYETQVVLLVEGAGCKKYICYLCLLNYKHC